MKKEETKKTEHEFYEKYISQISKHCFKKMFDLETLTCVSYVLLHVEVETPILAYEKACPHTR